MGHARALPLDERGHGGSIQSASDPCDQHLGSFADRVVEQEGVAHRRCNLGGPEKLTQGFEANAKRRPNARHRPSQIMNCYVVAPGLLLEPTLYFVDVHFYRVGKRGVRYDVDNLLA